MHIYIHILSMFIFTPASKTTWITSSQDLESLARIEENNARSDEIHERRANRYMQSGIPRKVLDLLDVGCDFAVLVIVAVAVVIVCCWC